MNENFEYFREYLREITTKFGKVLWGEPRAYEKNSISKLSCYSPFNRYGRYRIGTKYRTGTKPIITNKKVRKCLQMMSHIKRILK